MAEHSFQEVMHQFDRMCKANSGCINCPLHQNDYYSDDECHIGAFVRYPEKIEQTVMSWAAEHPEPVYPTWLEWLHTTSAVDDTIDIPVGDGTIFRVAIKNVPIPADIAVSLGLKPKEG